MIKSLKYWLRNTLGFSKTETNGFLYLVVLVSLFIFAPFFLDKIVHNKYTSGKEDKLILDSLVAELEGSSRFDHSVSKSLDVFSPSAEPFHFDPNTLSLDSLILLGIRKDIGERVIKYRNAGGSYKIKSDLKKIYGLPSETYEKLFSFIQLPEEEFKEPAKKSKFKKESFSEKKEPEFSPFDINEADTAQLKLVYGIGPVLSDRIVKYRALLGGFVYKEQLKEVYGIQEEAFINLSEKVYIKNTFIPKRININQDSLKNMAAHPYISYPIARAIFNYRLQHGKYVSKDDLQKIHLLDSSAVAKISPYITL